MNFFKKLLIRVGKKNLLETKHFVKNYLLLAAAEDVPGGDSYEDDLPLRVAKKPSDLIGESVPVMNYPKPHNVQKNRPELDGRQDTFEYPYAYGQRTKSSRKNGYGKRRKKRQTKSKGSTLHWGIYGISSSGN